MAFLKSLGPEKRSKLVPSLLDNAIEVQRLKFEVKLP